MYLFIKLNSLPLLRFCVCIETKLQELKELVQSTEGYDGITPKGVRSGGEVDDWPTFAPLKMVTLVSVHEATPGKECTWYGKAETDWLSGLLL